MGRFDPDFLFCAYCWSDQPAIRWEFQYCNGSRIMCDRCWLRYVCHLPWWRVAA